MALIVETGVGVRGANAYVPIVYVTNYLTARNRQTENSWSSSTTAVQEAAIVAATDYVDKRFGHRFRGLPSVSFDPEYAVATLTFAGPPSDGEILTLGDETYKFVASLSGASGEVLINGSGENTALNLEAALNGSGGGGLVYGWGTPPSRHAGAVAVGPVLTLTALAPGSSGSLTSLSGPLTNVTISAFGAARDGGIQNLCWPRTAAYDARGYPVEGVPDRLKQAVSEYAVRAVESGLLPDPTTDTFGGRVTARTEQVGPIVESYKYDSGTSGTITFTPYPSADRLLSPLLLGSGGRVIRG